VASVPDIIAATTITEVWRALGGDPPKHDRARAFYRNGDGQSVALDDHMNAYYDFRDGTGGGILHLIQRVKGGTRSDALKWLSEFTGIPLDGAQTATQRAEYVRRRERARQKAQDVEHWRKALVIQLNAEKLAAADAENDDALERAASLCNLLENGTPEQVIREFNLHQACDPPGVARLIADGAEHQREAERVTWNVVVLIADLEGFGSVSAA
jgi:hypothetical protein